jgi:hypothetical protein
MKNIPCRCCPNGISTEDVRCMNFRGDVRHKGRKAQAGRYAVDKAFPCEACGKIEAHPYHERDSTAKGS